VSRWRGGWQLSAPNTGSADAETEHTAFHGAASQAEWKIVEQTETTLKLSWMDAEGEIELVREWSFEKNSSVSVQTTATNKARGRKPVGFAEHLILGSRFLQPAQRGSVAKLTLCPASKILDLDYSGAPTGLMIESAATNRDFTELSASQPAKVFVVSGSKTKSISVQVDDWVARVEWQGFEHALVWQEFGTSAEAPWNSEVFALGIEPTNVPHGLGANEQDGPFLLPGERITWSTSVQFFRKED
jgi:galactose mutarotase-like enzyme